MSTPRIIAAAHRTVGFRRGAGARVVLSHLRDGETITVISRHGPLTVPVGIDDRIAPGVVSITHGRAAHSPGSLTSGSSDVDPLTAMPRASGVPVTIGGSRRHEPTPSPTAVVTSPPAERPDR